MLFRHILNYLRYPAGTVTPLPRDVFVCEQLALEADFFGFAELSAAYREHATNYAAMLEPEPEQATKAATRYKTIKSSFYHGSRQDRLDSLVNDAMHKGWILDGPPIVLNEDGELVQTMVRFD